VLAAAVAAAAAGRKYFMKETSAECPDVEEKMEMRKEKGLLH
jgi:hypothetical protein